MRLQDMCIGALGGVLGFLLLQFIGNALPDLSADKWRREHPCIKAQLETVRAGDGITVEASCAERK